MAAMRLNIPVIFVSGGPMEAGKTKLSENKLDLVDAMVIAVDENADDETVAEYERSACPTCGSCSGMFTANSMNCLTEALGLSLPGNGSLLATHADREKLFLEAGRRIVELAKRYYEEDDDSVLPRNIASREAFKNAMHSILPWAAQRTRFSTCCRRSGSGAGPWHEGHRRIISPRASVSS